MIRLGPPGPGWAGREINLVELDPVELAPDHPHRDWLAAGLGAEQQARTHSHQRIAITVPACVTATAQPDASR